MSKKQAPVISLPDKKTRADLERRLAICHDKRKELTTNSNAIFSLCKSGKITYEEYIRRTKEICNGYEFGEAIYAIDHEINECNEQLKAYKADPYVRNLTFASLMLVLVVAFGTIFISTYTTNFSALAVLNIENDTLEINVNSFIPAESILRLKVFGITSNYGISELMSQDEVLTIQDNISGYIIEKINIDLGDFNGFDDVTLSNVSIAIIHDDSLLFAVNYDDVDSQFSNPSPSNSQGQASQNNASSAGSGSSAPVIADNESVGNNSNISIHQYLHRVSSQVGSLEFAVAIDKEVYNVGEMINISILPAASKASIALIDQDSQASIIEGLKTTVLDGGNYTLDALITYESYNKRLKLPFTAIDSSNIKIVDNKTGVNVSILDSYGDVDKNITTLQYSAVVGIPVRIVKQVKVKNSQLPSIDLELPKEAQDIKIYMREQGSENQTLVKEDKVMIEKDGKTYSPSEFERKTGTDVGVAPLITGRVVIDETANFTENVTLTLTDNFVRNDIIEVEYYLDGPTLEQKHINETTQQVIISSNMSFVDILTFVKINETPKEAIALYHLENGSRNQVTEVEYIDSNENGFIDKVQWITPHLSTQVYELEIIVLNVVSFVSVDDVWTIKFNTRGTANLSIYPLFNTTFGEVKKDSLITPDDLDFISLSCDDIVLRSRVKDTNGTLLDHLLISNIDSIKIDEIFMPDYNCTGLGEIRFKIISNETHAIGLSYASANKTIDTGAVAITLFDKLTDFEYDWLNDTNTLILQKDGMTAIFENLSVIDPITDDSSLAYYDTLSFGIKDRIRFDNATVILPKSVSSGLTKSTLLKCSSQDFDYINTNVPIEERCIAWQISDIPLYSNETNYYFYPDSFSTFYVNTTNLTLSQCLLQINGTANDCEVNEFQYSDTVNGTYFINNADTSTVKYSAAGIRLDFNWTTINGSQACLVRTGSNTVQNLSFSNLYCRGATNNGVSISAVSNDLYNVSVHNISMIDSPTGITFSVIDRLFVRNISATRITGSSTAPILFDQVANTDARYIKIINHTDANVCFYLAGYNSRFENITMRDVEILNACSQTYVSSASNARNVTVMDWTITNTGGINSSAAGIALSGISGETANSLILNLTMVNYSLGNVWRTDRFNATYAGVHYNVVRLFDSNDLGNTEVNSYNQNINGDDTGLAGQGQYNYTFCLIANTTSSGNLSLLVKELGGTYSNCNGVTGAVGGVRTAVFVNELTTNGLADYTRAGNVWSNITIDKPLRIDYNYESGQPYISLSNMNRTELINSTLQNPRGLDGSIAGLNITGDAFGTNISGNYFLYLGVNDTAGASFCRNSIGNFYTEGITVPSSDCGQANVSDISTPASGTITVSWLSQDARDAVLYDLFLVNSTGAKLSVQAGTSSLSQQFSTLTYANGEYYALVVPYVTLNSVRHNATNKQSNSFNLTNVVPPTQGTPILSVSSTYNYTGDNLSVTNTSTTGDNVTHAYAWYKNNKPFAIGLYAFNQNVSSNASGAIKDFSGNENNGTLGAGTPANAPDWVQNCKVGGCYNFSASINKVIRATSAGYDNNSRQFAADMWVNGDLGATATQDYLFLYGDATPFLALRMETTNVLTLAFTASTCTGPDLDTAGWVNLSWNHIGFSFDDRSDTVYFYVNGIEYTVSCIQTLPVLDSQFLYLGNDLGGNSGRYLIDEMILYNHTVSKEQFLLHNLTRYNNISHYETQIGDTFFANVSATNSVGFITNQTATTVTILSNPPTQAAPLLNFSSANNGTFDNLTAINQSTSGIDPVTNAYSWRKDGQPYATHYLPFDIEIVKPDQGQVLDFSGNNNNGTLGSGIGGTDIPVWTANCKVGGCYNFSKSASLINHSVNGFPSTGGALSVEAWVHYDINIDATEDIIFYFGDATPFISLRQSTGNVLQFVFTGNAACAGPDLDTFPSWVNNDWNHIVAVFDDFYNYTSYYVNGLRFDTVAVCTNAMPTLDAQQLIIGNTYATTAPLTNGSIDEVIIYNHTLSQDEVLQHYNLRYNTLSNAALDTGQNWTVQVTPMTRFERGTNLSRSALIQNNSPTHNTPILNSSSGTNTSSENLTVYNQSTTSAVPARNIYSWILNNQSYTIFNMPFDEERFYSGEIISDFSNLSNHGTLGDNIGIQTPTYESNCKVGGCYRFNSSRTDEVITASINGYPAAGGVLTFDLWAKYNKTVSATASLISIGNSTAYIGLETILTSNILRLIFTGNAQCAGPDLDSSTWSDTDWNHIAVVFNDGTNSADFYVNGALTSISCTNAMPTTNKRMYIGNYHSGSRPINGFLDEIRLYNRSIGQNQILNSYNLRYNQIHMDETSVGETWTAAVTPITRYETGLTRLSDTMTIISAAPTHGTPLLNSTSQYNGTFDNLTAYNTSTSGVATTTNAFKWTVDSSPYQILLAQFSQEKTAAGDLITDYSLINGNGTLGAGSGSAVPTWTSSCKVGACFNYTDAADRINFTINGFPATGGVLSADVWINYNINVDATEDNILYFGDTTTYTALRITSGNLLTLYFTGNAQCAGPDLDTSTAWVNNAWNHIAISFDDAHDSVYFYINGVRTETSCTQAMPTLSTNQVIIGNNYAGTAVLTNALIDEVMVYNRSISQNQFMNHNSSRYSIIDDHETENSQVWIVNVTPSNQYENGLTKSANMTVLANTPTQGTPILTSYSGYNATDDNITLSNQSVSSVISAFRAYNYYINSNPFITLMATFDQEKIISGQGIRDFTSGNDGTFGANDGLSVPTYVNSCKVGGCYNYSDTDDRINFTISNFPTTGGALSFDMWVNYDTTSSAAQNYILHFGNATIYVSAQIDTGNILKLYFTGNAQCTGPDLDTYTPWLNGNWNYLGFVFDDTANYVNFFINGESYKVTCTNAMPSINNQVTVGNYFSGANVLEDALIDELRIYNKTLTREQMLNHYNLRYGILSPMQTVISDSIEGEITMATKYEVGSGDASNTFTILTDTPTHNTPLFNATSIGNSSQDNLTAYNQSTDDASNSRIYNNYNWFLNNASIAIVNAPLDTYISPATRHVNVPFRDFSGLNPGQAPTSYQAPSYMDSCKVGGCYLFDGDDDYIEFNSSATLAGYRTTSGSYDFWIKPKTSRSSDSSEDYLVYLTSTHFIALNASNKLNFRIGVVTVSGPNVSGFNNNTWQHIAVTYADSNNENEAKIYLNGVLNTTSTTAFNAPAATALDLGGFTTAGGSFNGQIDEFRAYNFTLTAEQVRNHYNLVYNELAASMNNPGDSWSVNVTPLDSFESGLSKKSSAVSIVVLCGDTITASYNLTGNLENFSAGNQCGTTGLTIAESNVVLNCNGYNVTGNNSGIGFNLSGINGTSIQGCNLNSFSDGFIISNSNVTIRHTKSLNMTRGIYISGGSNVTLINASLGSTDIFISSDSELNATNLTFNTTAGSVRYASFNINSTTINTTNKFRFGTGSVYVNSSNISAFNRSASIVFRGLSAFSNPSIKVDPEDDGTFVACSSPRCIGGSFSDASDTYSVNISGFTNYTLQDSITCGSTILDSLIFEANLQNSTGGTECPAGGLTVGISNIFIDCAGYTMNGSSTGSTGIDINSFNNVTVRNCTIADFGQGILLTSSSNDTFVNNSFYNNTQNDIFGDSSSHNANVTRSLFVGSGLDGSNEYNIDLAGDNVVVTNNIVRDSFESGINTIVGIVMNSGANNFTVKDNNISNSDIGIATVNAHNGTIRDNILNNLTDGGIAIVVSSSDVLVYNNTLNNVMNGTYSAIFAADYTANSNPINITIDGNLLNNSGGRSLVVQNVRGSLIQNNRILNSSLYGLYINNSNNSIVTANRVANVGEGVVTATNESSVFVERSINLTVNNNTLSDNDYALVFLNSRGILVTSNNISNTTVLGTRIEASNHTVIRDNIYVRTGYNSSLGLGAVAVIGSNAAYSINNLTIANNTMTNQKNGIHLQLSMAGIYIENNTINATIGGAPAGLFIRYSLSSHIYENLSVKGNVIDAFYGIYTDVSSAPGTINTIFRDNTIYVNQSGGFGYVLDLKNVTLVNETVVRSEIAFGCNFCEGITINDSRINSVVHSLSFGELGSSTIYSNNNLFNNTALLVDASSGYSNLTAINTTFNNTHGSVFFSYFNISANSTGKDTANNFLLRNRSVYLNSSYLPGMNKTASLVMRGLTGFSTAIPYVDPEDDGSPIACSAPRCTDIVFDDPTDTLTFTVSSFTNYTAQNVVMCGDTLTANTTLTDHVRNSTAGTDCTAAGLTLDADNIVLDCAGYIINGSNTDTAVTISSRNNITIKNCLFTEFNLGISISTGTNVTILNDTFLNITGDNVNTDVGSDTLIVRNSTFYGTDVVVSSNGVFMRSNNALVENNQFHGLYGASPSYLNVMIYASGSSGGARNMTIRNNNLSSGFIGIASVQSNGNYIINNTLRNMTGGGIAAAVSARSILIENNTLTNARNTTYSAIFASDYLAGFPVDNITIKGNTLNNSEGKSIVLNFATNSTVENNILDNSTEIGVFLNRTNNSIMRFNRIMEIGESSSTSNESSVYLLNVKNTTVYSNNISNNDFGLYLENVTNVSVYRNIFQNDSSIGIYVLSFVDLLTIYENTINITNHGIAFISASGLSVNITANNISQTSIGLYIPPALSSPLNGTIDSNRILNASSQGIGPTASRFGNATIKNNFIDVPLSADNGINILPLGNSYFINNTIIGSSTGFQITGGGTYTQTLINNTIINFTGVGLHATNAIILGGIINSSFANIGLRSLGNVINVSDLTIDVANYSLSSSSNVNSSITNSSFILRKGVNITNANVSLLNVTFLNGNGSVKFINVTINDSVSMDTNNRIIISNNSVFVNSTNLTRFNTTASVIMRGLTGFSTAIPYVDVEDDGTFIPCASPKCSDISFDNSADTLTFTASSFTNFTSNTTTLCGDTITTSVTLGSHLLNSTAGTECPDDGLLVGANNLEINCAGYTINGSARTSGMYGVTISNRTNVTVKNCIIADFENGIYTAGILIPLSVKNNFTFINNTFINNSATDITGTLLNNVMVANSTFDGTGNTAAFASAFNILFSGASNSTARGNTIINNNPSTNVIALASTSDNTIFRDNNITGVYAGVYAYQGDNAYFFNNTVRNTSNGGLAVLNDAHNALVENNTLLYVGNGTFASIFVSTYGISASNNATIRNNVVNNSRGRTITLQGSYNSTIINNMIDNSTETAIFTNESYESTITLNSIVNVGEFSGTSNESSINLLNSGNITVSSNNVSENDYGVFVQNSTDINISRNIFINGSWGGIVVQPLGGELGGIVNIYDNVINYSGIHTDQFSSIGTFIDIFRNNISDSPIGIFHLIFRGNITGNRLVNITAFIPIGGASSNYRNTTIKDNYVTHTSSNGALVFAFGSTGNNYVINNTLIDIGSIGSTGIRVSGPLTNITLINNTIINHSAGMSIRNAVGSGNIINSTLPSSRGLISPDGNVYLNNTIIEVQNYSVFYTSGSGLVLNNITSNLNKGFYINGSNATLLNFTFISVNGTLQFYNITVNDTEHAITEGNYSIKNNSIYINSTSSPKINSSAKLTLKLLTGFTIASPFVDVEDDGTFVPCIAPKCTNSVFDSVADTLTFDASSFTNFTADNLMCGETVTSNIIMVSNVLNDTGGDQCPAAGLVVGASNIVLDCAGYIINGSTTGHTGIDINGYNNVTIRNCTIADFGAGISLTASSNDLLTNNSFYNNTNNDITADTDSNNLNVSRSLFVGSGLDSGNDYNVQIYGDNAIVENNIIRDSFESGINTMVGIVMNSGANNFTVRNNNISHSDIGIATAIAENGTIRDNILNNLTDGGIAVVYTSKNVLVYNNTLNNVMNGTYSAIFVSNYNSALNPQNITLNSNRLYDSGGRSIVIQNVNLSTIIGNTVDNSSLYGIYVNNSNSTLIAANRILDVGFGTVTAINESSVFVERSINTNVTNNTLSDNDYSLVFLNSQGISVISNNISNTTVLGTRVERSNHTIIRGNTYTRAGYNTTYAIGSIDIIGANIVTGQNYVTRNITVVNNTITEQRSAAVRIGYSVSNVYIENNTFNSSLANGISFLGSSSYAFENMTVKGNIMDVAYGFSSGALVSSPSISNVMFRDNRIYAEITSGYGYYLDMENVSLINETLYRSNVGLGCNVCRGIIINDSIMYSTGYVFELAAPVVPNAISLSNNLFNSTAMLATAQSGTTYSNITAINTTFNNTLGSVFFRYFNITANSTAKDTTNHFRINFNNTFLNSSYLPGMNKTATITIRQIPSLENVSVKFAPNDNSTFRFCQNTKCQNLTYNNAAGTATFDVTDWTNYSIRGQNAPSIPVLIFPNNNNHSIFANAPVFLWVNSTDSDGDVITYEINITHSLCADIYETALSEGTNGNTTFNPSSYLCTSLNSTQPYNWTVRAYDGLNYSSWAGTFNFTINATLIINLTVNSVNFGSKAPGDTDNTSDDSPAPIVLANNGNIMANVVRMYALDALFDLSPLNRSNFQFKIDNTSEVNSFNYSGSVTSYTNISDTNSDILFGLDHNDSRDSAQIDLLINVPLSEPAGSKSSTLIFVGEAS